MEEIPAVYWMIVFGGLSIMFCLILFYIAMLIKEATSTVVEVRYAIRDSRDVIKNANKIVEDSSEIVTELKGSLISIKGTIDEVNAGILTPIKKIGSLVSSVSGFLEGLKK